MRIGIFDPYLDTLSGGEKYMLSVASCLAQEHEVFIFWDKEKEVEVRQSALEKLGIDLSSVKFYSNIFDKKTSLLSRFAQSWKFDAIVYLSDGSIPLVGTRLYVHFQFPIEWVNGKSPKTKLKLSFVKDVVCNSYFTKHFIDRKLNVNSKVLYPPVVINRDEKTKRENVILHVGRLYVDEKGSNYKKQDIMIKVFKKMVDNGLKDWRLIIVVGARDKGRASLNKLREMSKGYGIEVIENPSQEELWESYSKAAIYWHATGFDEDLEKHPERAEHFGISTVEAMGTGVVPVVINAGGQKEIVEDGKNGYLWNNLVEFTHRTESLIKDPKLMGKMSKEAIVRSKIFSKDRFCRDLKNIIS